MTIAVFRSYVAEQHQSENDRLYGEMNDLVQECPGYQSHKLFTAPDGEVVVIVESKDLESLEGWGHHSEHEKAQAAGKDHVYDSYDVAVCEVVERHTKPRTGVQS